MTRTVPPIIFQNCMALYLFSLVVLVGELRRRERSLCELCVRARGWWKEAQISVQDLINSKSGLMAPGP